MAKEDMTAADAAKLVSRKVPVIGKDKKPTGEIREVPIKASEVFDYKDHGEHVVVVTNDGQKFRGEKAAK